MMAFDTPSVAARLLFDETQERLLVVWTKPFRFWVNRSPFPVLLERRQKAP